MMRTVGSVMLALAVVALVGQVALAQVAEEKPATPPATEKHVAAEKPAADFGVGKGLAVVGACIGAGLCAIGGGFAIGRVGGATLDAIARQPEAAGQMFTPMIVAGAMIEGGMFFAIVIALLCVLKL